VPIVSGRPPTTAQLVRLQTVIYSAVQSNTGAQTFTTTEADSVGCTVTFTTATAGATYTVYGVGDFEVTAASAAVVAVGRLAVDGTTITSKEMHLRADAVGRATVSQVWTGSLPASGSHTIKLRILKNAAGGTMQANDNHTSIVFHIMEVV
jgi:hypothetical protein